MMLRDEWRFPYSFEDLLAAATAQRDFRAARVQVWEGKKAEVIGRIKESGINVSDSLAADMNNNTAKYLSTHSRRGPQITIDATMQADLDECFGKIQHHKSLFDQYAAWVQVFESQPKTGVLELQHDDWMFFFGK